MVYYRKYRPQLISELDLGAVREKLISLLSSSDIPHAFLFTGSKGLGKTSSARILAKAVNCLSKLEGSVEPCNICDTCISITNGSHIDVIEIDAASNRGIDEMRDLREKVKFAPSTLTKKVYIIDEVHMLTTEAFNALLKTLEEPPAHVVFILATTEMWKLPATIVSRVFHVQFEKPTKEEVMRSLARIVLGEKLELEEGVLEKVFSLADGAFRDAAKILEELSLASSGAMITHAVLEKSYKTDSIEQEVTELLKHLSFKNTKDALMVVDRLTASGVDFKIVIEKAVEKLRTLLFIKAGFETTATFPINFDLESLELLLDQFQEAYKALKSSVFPQLPLEILIVKYCMTRNQNNELRIKNKEEVAQLEKTVSPKQFNGVTIQQFGSNDLMRSLIDRVKKDNFSVAGILRSTKIMQDGDRLEIISPFKFHGQKLQEREVKVLLETCASEILGKTVTLVVTIQAS